MPESIGQKVAHVRSAGQSRDHHCHWPGCDRQVPPAKWGCTRHWYQLPKDLRTRIWRAYRVGQEQDGRPSPAYLEVARAVQVWIASRPTAATPAQFTLFFAQPGESR